ncbi:prion-inhibition and propagation-domain-containing protein [Amylocarpus encephaloides]|uniref:Prion-inhibition and propagation-domain-containing protein n=1 Tax=Amylocarpus encephaloides TaxID=45428 RepID=A0A9P8C9B6_9HELO|nr:prion-inhibition and propagation-domain-containing protein [Amylocarpus encephaloides]
MVSLVNLFLEATNRLKCIITTQEFGAEYEMVCTELRVQWLRIRLWGESVGINIDDPDLTRAHVFTRPEIQLTVTQAVGSITHLLSDVESLRHKYDVKPDWQALSAGMDTDNKSQGSISRRLSSLPTSITPLAMSRRRMNDNQKQASFLKLAKWAMSDAKKFEEKVAQLKRIIDSLESVSRFAERSRQEPPEYSQAIRERPPRYSDGPTEEPLSAHGLPTTAPQDAFSLPFLPAQSPLSPPRWSHPPWQFSVHYTAFTTYMTGIAHTTRVNTRAKDMLASLSSVQFSELRTDVYDDLLRRQEYEGVHGHVFHDLLDRGQEQSHSDVFISCLPDRDAYHPKRNLARRRLSSLAPAGFKDLVRDVLAEMDRRVSLPISPLTTASPSSSTSTPLPGQSHLTCARTPSSPTMTSFHVSPRSTTQDVLPLAMEKYSMPGPPSQYCLTINCGGVERFLQDDENPLAIFRGFERGFPPHPKVVVRRKLSSDPLPWTPIPDEPVTFLHVKDILTPPPSSTAGRLSTTSSSSSPSTVGTQDPHLLSQNLASPHPSTSTTSPSEWPLPRVLAYLKTHSFSPEWQATFTTLNICNNLFPELGTHSHGKGNPAFMFLQIFPQLEKECVASGKGWDSAREMAEGKRLRRGIRVLVAEERGSEQGFGGL